MMQFDPEKRPVFVLADGSTVPAIGVTIHGTGIEGTIVAIVVEGVTYTVTNRPCPSTGGGMLDMHPGDTAHITVGDERPIAPPPPIATHEGWKDRDGYEWAPDEGANTQDAPDGPTAPIDDDDPDGAIDQFELI